MKQLLEETTFVGRPFADQLMDEQKTFTNSNLELEQDQLFQQFLVQNNLTKKRASMIVFGPENFMYWYGVTAPSGVSVPQGLMKFVLPKAEVAVQEVADQSLACFSQPLNQILPQFMQQVADSGIQIYENPGDSPTPFFIQDLNLTTKKLAQILYLAASH